MAGGDGKETLPIKLPFGPEPFLTAEPVPVLFWVICCDPTTRANDPMIITAHTIAPLYNELCPTDTCGPLSADLTHLVPISNP